MVAHLLWTYALTPVGAAVHTAWEEHKQEEARQKEEDAKKDVIEHWWGTEIVSHPCTRLAIGEHLPVYIKAGYRRDFCEADYHRQLAWTTPMMKDGQGCVRGLADQTQFFDGTCNGVPTPDLRLGTSRVTFWAVTDVTFVICDKSCTKR